VEDIIRTLERDAEAQAAARMEQARERAEAVRAEAEREASARRRVILGEREEELRADGRRKVAQAGRESRATVLQAEQRVLERIFAKATSLLEEPSSLETYQTHLSTHLGEALAYVGTRPVTVICKPQLADAVRHLLSERQSVRVRADQDAPLGLVVVSDDGALTVDNSVAGRLRRLKAELSSTLLKRLGEHS